VHAEEEEVELWQRAAVMYTLQSIIKAFMLKIMLLPLRHSWYYFVIRCVPLDGFCEPGCQLHASCLLAPLGMLNSSGWQHKGVAGKQTCALLKLSQCYAMSSGLPWSMQAMCTNVTGY
jgi:hypothetical protein